MLWVKVKLVTDFYDIYDIWFDREGDTVLERLTTSGLSRGPMLRFLNDKGIQTVRFGTCEELSAIGCKKVVVYKDTNTHCGNGKILMDAMDATMSFPNFLASEYCPLHKGVSIRHLQLGELWFKLQYKSVDDWRSNCGSDVDIKVLDCGVGYHETIDAPIFAIDFVETADGLMAIDYNIAPGCRWTGIEQLVKPKVIAESIKSAIEKNLIKTQEA